jgi:hypothetical protein
MIADCEFQVTPTPLFTDAIPTIYHASREARIGSKYDFHSEEIPNYEEAFYGPVVNYDTDISFINKSIANETAGMRTSCNSA